MLQTGMTVAVKPVYVSVCDWWWKVGRIEIIDPYTDGKDVYGVKFPNEANHPFFSQEELEVSNGPKCACCGREGVHLNEVADSLLCDECIAPPRQ
jgi:hypothetical protein